MSKKIKIVDIAILAIFLSFLVAYLGISFYNRAMQDDFWFYSRVKTLGIIPAVLDFYYYFEGAFACFFWVHFLAYINQYSTCIFFINVFNLILLFTSLFLLVTCIIKNVLSDFSTKIPFYLSILIITSILYFQSDVVQQSVFWFNGSIAYMSTISWFLFGIYFLLKNGNVNFIISALLLFSFSAVRLHYSIIESGVLFYFLLWYFLEFKKINIRIEILLIIVMTGFAIYLVAPGNYIGRFNGGSQMLLNTPLAFYFTQVIHSLVYYFYVHIFKILPLLLMNFSLAFILGLKDEKSVIALKTFFSFAKFSIYAVAVGWLSLAIVMAVVAHGTGMSRTFFLSLFITVMLINIFLYFSGILLREKFQFFSRLALPIGLIACGYFIHFLFSDIDNLKKMNLQYDQRIESIVNAKNILTSKDTLYLEKLPYSKTLMSNELKEDVYVQLQENFLKLYYNTPFQIKLIPQKNISR